MSGAPPLPSHVRVPVCVTDALVSVPPQLLVLDSLAAAPATSLPPLPALDRVLLPPAAAAVVIGGDVPVRGCATTFGVELVDAAVVGLISAAPIVDRGAKGPAE